MSKKFDLDAYISTVTVADTPHKKDKFIVLDECLHAVLGMPGIPLGHITQVFGKSDTGKTSLMFHAAAEAQKQDILPVIIITEGKVSWDRAELMGFDRSKAIIIEDKDYLEDVFQTIDKLTADVGSGLLPKDICIFWDSVGNTLSRDEVIQHSDGTVEKKSTMMKAAKVISENMRIISKKINDTRKISYPKAVGLFLINQCYTKPPTFPGGIATMVPYGGDAIWYKSSLVLKTQRTKKLAATKNGVKLNFGITSKITVDKNHITNVAHSGEFVITADSIIPNEPTAIKNYKDSHKDGWGEIEFTEDHA